MEKLYLDFINGDEVKMIKNLLKVLNTFILTGVALGYLVILYLATQFTIAITAFAIASLFATHFIKKWSKSQ